MSGILCAFSGGGVPEVVLNISNTFSVDLQARLAAAEWDGISAVRLVIDPGAKVNTLVIPQIVFPNGLYLLVGAGAWVGGTRGINSRGGDALFTRVPITIENYGSFLGGGGAGGTGGSAWVQRASDRAWGYGGNGGTGQGFENPGSLNIVPPTAGAGGTSGTTNAPMGGGGGGFGGGSGSASADGGAGGQGGGWRQAGYAGNSSAIAGTYEAGSAEAGSSGYPPGLNINGVEFVTWQVRGDA